MPLSLPSRLFRPAAPVLVLGAACTGCVVNGARVEIAADQARYPISMTAALPDATGNNLRVGHELVTRGRLSGEATTCSFVYGVTPATVEISDIVNDQVRAAGGEGVAGLVVEATDRGWGWAFPLAWLPFWPGCLAIRVSGTIVAQRPAARPARRPVQAVAAPPTEPEPPAAEPAPPRAPASSAPAHPAPASSQEGPR
jgi:hypothetical protein